MPRMDPPPSWLIPGRYASEAAAHEERARLARRLKPMLDDVVRGRDQRAARELDPVSFVHRVRSPSDRELVGLLASSLAYGNIKVIKRSIANVLSIVGSSPSARVASMSLADLRGELSGFVHRFTRGDDVAALLFAAVRCQEANGSLGALFTRCYDESNGNLRQASCRFVSRIRGVEMRPCWPEGELPKGLSYLLPDGRGPGACKRLHMYLRWMVRGPDGIDLGLWKNLPPAILQMPLDTHTSRICRYLGLTNRRDASWRTAEEVTWHLRGIDPEDPVRYDFALAHLGISGGCRHIEDEKICSSCALRDACRV